MDDALIYLSRTWLFRIFGATGIRGSGAETKRDKRAVQDLGWNVQHVSSKMYRHS